MRATDPRPEIVDALKAFHGKPLPAAARNLLGVLGYRRQRDERAPRSSIVDEFLTWHEGAHRLAGLADKDQAEMRDRVRGLHFLFQLTDLDIQLATGTGLRERDDSGESVDGAPMECYLVVAVELAESAARTRPAMARLVRMLNKALPMPTLILLRHGDALTFGILHRQLPRRSDSKDVLEKVTLIKDITCTDPLHAHVEILQDLSLQKLYGESPFHDLVGWQQAWEKRLGSGAHTERFYREVANWHLWALTHSGVKLPRSMQAVRNTQERDKQRALFFIRLLARMIFCWFLREQCLIPRELFRERVIKELLKDHSPRAGTFYRAILQNLFFATLNQQQASRAWIKKHQGSGDGNRGDTNLWRYQDLLTDPARLEGMLRDQVPFINGGLFDCLDVVRDDQTNPNVRLDDFTQEPENRLCLPNELFFGAGRDIDLGARYQAQRRRHEKVRGLIEILGRYKFTVEENTPLEEELALDPELLGTVLENLLASYNEDTRTTARKAFGAFYTPRAIVSYMVDESLRSYLAGQVSSANEEKLRLLLATDRNEFHAHEHFGANEIADLVSAIGRVKILDPACGSGAFPMGALHRLVDLLQKLDPHHEGWKRDRLAEIERSHEWLRSSNASREALAECSARIEEMRRSFDPSCHALDFSRKLYLIENCIYGVDILPMACQIVELRFFMALMVDQRVDGQAPNLGVRPLPNLETRMVAADALVPMKRPGSVESGFDVVIGNPPYVRLQTLKQQDAELAAFYKEHYQSARKGNYDLSVVFVEAGLNLLKRGGHLAYILPHKFFNAQYGEPLRTLIARGQSLRHVVHFGDQQVFPGATSYVCLLFLASSGVDRCRFVRADNLGEWLTSRTGAEGVFAAHTLTSSGWNFALGTKGEVLQRLQAAPRVLGEVAARVFQGIIPGADRVYAVEVRREAGGVATCWSKALEAEVLLDASLLRPIVSGTDIARFCYASNRMCVIYPYQVAGGRAKLISPARLRKEFSRTFRYFQEVRPILDRRDSGSAAGPLWYRYIRTQNIALQTLPKIMVPRLVRALKAAYDEEGGICLDNVDVGGITVPADGRPLAKFLVALLNSAAVNFVFQHTAAPFRGGFFSANRQFIAPLPIASATAEQETLVVRLADYLLWANRHFREHASVPSAQDGWMLGYFEQVLNGLVYELYFTDELHARGLRIFEIIAQANLPVLDSIPVGKRMAQVRAAFETISGANHPLCGALHRLRSLAIVRIIEGEP